MKIRILLGVIVALLIGSGWFYQRVVYDPPFLPDVFAYSSDSVQTDGAYYRLGPNWLHQHPDGNWESYIEGNAVARGFAIGQLHRHLIRKQEEVFVNELQRQIPNSFYRRLLTLGIAWFNRDLDQYIPTEYREEMAAIAGTFSDEYDHIGPKYNRLVNYHAAHDIGHAVQNMRLVGCTATGTWTRDSTQMVVGRNFDFYVGDDFAKNKIVLFINPDQGYKFVSITWGGFCGVVSGMNEHGLGITLNSIKSAIPSQTGTPVSIIAREILQYARNLSEAIAIAQKYTSFVSESFTLSSAADNTVAVIEKTPESTDVYWPKDTSLVVTNHCQSPNLKNTPLNLEHKAVSESPERFARAQQLLLRMDKGSPEEMAVLLRDQLALDDSDIGVSNPELINQLIAHHAVIFKNLDRQIWVSSYPYQINNFIAYDLDDFVRWPNLAANQSASIDSLTIEADPFYQSPAYQNFERFKQLKNQIIEATADQTMLDDFLLQSFAATNPNYYDTYRLLGNYYAATGDKNRAIGQYEISLSKKIAYVEDSLFMVDKIKSFQP